MSVKIGAKGHIEQIVTQELTAAALGNGSVNVFATPFMIALMENAAVKALECGLEPGQGSVGTKILVSHDSATPVGIKVWAEAEVTAIEGRRIKLSVKACDEYGQIGSGTHERFLIDLDSFLSKTAKRKGAEQYGISGNQV